MKKKMIAISALFLFALAFLFNVNSRNVKENSHFITESIDLTLAYSDDVDKAYMACGPLNVGICIMCDGTYPSWTGWGPLIDCAASSETR